MKKNKKKKKIRKEEECRSKTKPYRLSTNKIVMVFLYIRKKE